MCVQPSLPQIMRKERITITEMKKSLLYYLTVLSLIIIILIAPLSLTGCSNSKTLYLFNYGDYIDPEVYELFEEKYGIRIIYDEYAAPEDMYAKFTSGSAKYDLICTSDYMLEKLIREDLVAEIDFSVVDNIKNIGANHLEASKSFDPELKYTVPHFWGTLGILYNTETVDSKDVKSWNSVFEDKYAEKIIMPNSERDAFFVALTHLGYDANTKNEAELNAAAKLLREQKKNVQAYLLDEAARVKIESGNADIAVIYNGEAYLAFENNDKLDFVIPDEGTCMWIDSFAIPKDAANKNYAELFLNFLCSKEIAKINFEYIYYSTPNQSVLDSLDKEIISEKAIFPSDSVFEKTTVLKYLGTETEKLYSKLWKSVKS